MRERLGATGPWTVEAGDDELEIVGAAPPALAADWMRRRLVFRIDSNSGDFDPDDGLFALWESFRDRAGELLTELKERVRQAYKLKE